MKEAVDQFSIRSMTFKKVLFIAKTLKNDAF